MNDLNNLVGKTAQTNYYQVSFSTLKKGITDHLSKYSGIADINNILSRETGILCSDASLPTSSFATGEVKDNFMGINQEFAHTRIYTDLDFTFYVDTKYNTIKIFEGWMDYISGGAIEDNKRQFSSNYYRRFNYPDDYKVQTMWITKFEKDYNPQIPYAPGSQIEYQFINAFPKTITSIPVSYGPADLLKVTVSFNYDRYIVNPKGVYTKSNSSNNFNEDITRRYDIKNLTDKERNELAGKIVPDTTSLGGKSFVFDAKTQAALDDLANK